MGKSIPNVVTPSHGLGFLSAQNKTRSWAPVSISLCFPTVGVAWELPQLLLPVSLTTVDSAFVLWAETDPPSVTGFLSYVWSQHWEKQLFNPVFPSTKDLPFPRRLRDLTCPTCWLKKDHMSVYVKQMSAGKSHGPRTLSMAYGICQGGLSPAAVIWTHVSIVWLLKWRAYFLSQKKGEWILLEKIYKYSP